MDKSSILHIIFFLSLIIMFIAIGKIAKKQNLSKNLKSLLIYITIIIPFLGYFLISRKENKNDSKE